MLHGGGSVGGIGGVGVGSTGSGLSAASGGSGAAGGASGSASGGSSGGGGASGGGSILGLCSRDVAPGEPGNKLTRHILTHSLESLKYREVTHLIHPSHLALHHELTQVALAAQQAQSPSPSQLPSPHYGHHRGSGPHTITLEQMLAEQADGMSELELAAVLAAQPIGGLGMGQAAAAAAALSGSPLGGGGAPDQGNNVVLCKFCGKSFPDVTSLITHLPVHTGDRPFKCEYCGKAFKLRHHMKDHCRVHTGERPFRCGMCGKTFSRSTILKAHEKTHYPKYARKFMSSPPPIDGKDDSPQ
ncbi:AGAP000585-PA-like protein [Anopheles sinensis]|uniref:AGAP000585-PA-like protein n=1 Tax=Anopheles sinensis TaxID=74873 RepID=A0A084VQ48_ANOSI|nr:AGAP000585-PA-like protein [Anopheles sinensis]